MEGQFNNPVKVGLIYTVLPDGPSKVEVATKKYRDNVFVVNPTGLTPDTRYRLRLV